MSSKVLIRIIGAPLLLAALAGVLYLDYRLERPLGVIAVLAFFAVASYRELCAMARLKDLRPAQELGTLALMAAYASAFVAFWKRAPAPVDWTTVLLAYLLLVLVLMVVRYGRFSLADAGVSLLGAAYVSLLIFVVIPLEGRDPARSFLYLAFLGATNKGSDMAAYVFGKLFGRHKMAPVVSPNKTWEGALAGLVVGAGAGAIVLERTALRAVLGAPPLWAVCALAVAVTVAAQVGDLVKSAVKRWAGVKDSGRLLPEFGGALDMCDSFLLSAPLAWLGMRLL